MTRKFTFLLMALLALAGFKSRGQQALPYSYGFENNDLSAAGWTMVNYSTTNPLGISNQDYYTGNYSFCFSSLNNPAPYDQYLISPQISASSNFVLQFYHKSDSWQPEAFQVGYSTTNGDISSFTFGTTIYNPYDADWHLSEEFNFPVDTKYVAIHYCSQWLYNFYVDDFTFTAISSCSAPTGLTASNVTAEGATISWNDDDAESYDIAYGVASTFDLSNPATYTLQSGLTATSVQLSGLTAETEYKCAVKAHCSDEEESAWSSAVTFMPTAKMTLTVNESSFNNYNDRVPFQGYNADGLTTSQFIIPAATLTAMEGADISAMEFYTTTSGSDVGPADYTFNGSWDVYFKIVDYVIMPFSYESSEGMDKVYTGNMVISNNKMTLTFSEPYTYEGGNLMIYFNQTQTAGYKSTYWRGVTTSEYAARAGYVGSYSSENANYYFLPTTTFTYEQSGPRYNVTVDNAITGGSISANPVKATAGTIIDLSATPDYGYEFGAWVENYEDVEIVNNQFTMPEHDVTISATFNALTQYDINLAEVTGGTIHADYNGQTITEAPAGTEITLVAEAATDYIFEYFTVDGVQIPGNTYTMGTSDIEIGASFRTVQSYTINYYVNGEIENTLQCREDQFVSIDAPVNIPAGVSFEGWGVASINTYLTEKPAIVGNYELPTQNYDLYAVFSYSEQIPATSKEGEKWVEVTNPTDLSDGDQVIFVEKNNNKVLAARTGEYDGCFRSADITISNNEISSIPSNAVVFETESTSGSWKFWFDDVPHPGLTTLTDYAGGYLVPMSMNWGGSDLWTIISNGSSVNIQGGSGNYIVYKSGDFNVDGSSAYKKSSLFKKKASTITNTYYMTEVLTNGEIAENTTAKNIIISSLTSINVKDGATLTMDANGLFRNENEYISFMFEDGAQFYYTGEETIKAIFEKEITGYTDDNDNYYLIANPTDNTAVLFLDDYDYDLYTFDPTQALEWQNERVTEGTPVVTRGTGYLYASAVNNALRFTGNLIPAGSTNKSLTYAAAGEGIDFPGFNLIGNPYACNAYVGKSFYVIEGNELTLSGSAYVAPCEGFFVEAAEDDLSVTLSTTVPAPTSLLNLTVSQNRGNVIDRAIVRFDGANDLHKFMLNPQRTNIRLAKNGEEFAAISSENEGEIPVSFKAEKNGSYTITVNTENVEANYLHLIDNLTGMDTDLLNTPSYTFNASTSDYAYRFKLVFSMTDVEENESNANSYAYISNGDLVIDHIEGEATMQIVDMLGRVVSTEIVSGSYNKALNLKAGLYIINLNGMTQKIVVK